MSRWRSAACAAAMCVASVGASADEKIDFATVVQAFDQMVLREQGRVSKWVPGNKQLTLKVTAKFAERENTILNANLAALSEHAKLNIVRDDTAEKPDFLVETTKTLKPHPGVDQRYIGMTYSTWGRLGSEMRAATIQIIDNWARNNPYAIYLMIPHELMHALGFHGHPLLFDSALSVKNTRNSMSEWDLFFVRVLYDPKLPVGTPRVFALPLACKLINERLIAEANPDVTNLNRVGPHPYCEYLEATREIAAKTPVEELRLGWAYLRGLGVKQDFAEAERWAQKALADKDQDAQNLISLIEKTKQVAKILPSVATLKPVEFKPPAVGTIFKLNANSSLRIDRIDGGTVHTVSANDTPYRWAGLFFGRGERIPVSDAEKAAAAIWPLTLGKSVKFQHSGIRSAQPSALKTTIKVLRTETLKIDGRDIATYVVERRSVDAAPPASGEPYEAVYTFWYAPEFGFHVRYRTQFKGATTERPVSWTVDQVIPPRASR